MEGKGAWWAQLGSGNHSNGSYYGNPLNLLIIHLYNAKREHLRSYLDSRKVLPLEYKEKRQPHLLKFPYP